MKKLLPQSFFIKKQKKHKKNIVLSDSVTNNDGSFDGLKMINY